MTFLRALYLICDVLYIWGQIKFLLLLLLLLVPQLIKLTLKQHHKSNIVSLNEVNGKLANLSSGCNDDKSKPTQITTNCVVDEASLPGKATEKWCLFRILPLLISEYIPVDDAYGNLF